MPDLSDAHVGIADDVCEVGKSLILYISGDLHTLADGLAGLAEFVSAEFFVIDSGNFDMDINTV